MLDPYTYRCPAGHPDPCPVCSGAPHLEELLMYEGPQTVAAVLLETVTGTNGILVPPDGYMQGVRALCDKYGILMIADEVMSGFGRTGRWFAIEHWGVVPDMITMAKGLTSAYVQLGAVAIRQAIADTFKDKPFPGGLTYSSHPLACATALATIGVYEEDGLIERASRTGVLMADLLADLSARHPSVGAVRSIGLFGIVELVRDAVTKEPLSPFGQTSEPMKRFAQFLRDEGLYTFVRWHNFFTNPPLCITEEELREAFGMIDRALARLERDVLKG
jgi:taurine--2-oxoglutarate transaminase